MLCKLCHLTIFEGNELTIQIQVDQNVSDHVHLICLLKSSLLSQKEAEALWEELCEFMKDKVEIMPDFQQLRGLYLE